MQDCGHKTKGRFFMSKGKIIITLVLTFLMAAATGFAADKYQWKLIETADGCHIYTSSVAGKDYIAAKTSCTIPARIEVIGTILRDIENYPEWMEDCKETKMIKTLDEKNDVFIFWFRQHITLLTDRDMVIKSKTVIDVNSGRNLIYADATGDVSYDAGKGYVRMPSFNSLFTLEWVDRERTRVTFMIDPDLGEGVPSGVANKMITRNPFNTLKKMAKMAKKSKYVEAAKTNKYGKMAEDTVKVKAERK
jgi:hypothetical protein